MHTATYPYSNYQYFLLDKGKLGPAIGSKAKKIRDDHRPLLRFICPVIALKSLYTRTEHRMLVVRQMTDCLTQKKFGRLIPAKPAGEC